MGVDEQSIRLKKQKTVFQLRIQEYQTEDLIFAKGVNMANTNVDIINKFFEAYGKRDMEGLKEALWEDVQWIFPGNHKLSGIKKGIAEVIEFFDIMGSIMSSSNTQVEKLVMGINEDYVSECQYIHTDRNDKINLNQNMCVLWKFKDGRIIEGQHLISNQKEADDYFQTA